MSVINETPKIDTIISALSDTQKATLLSILNTNDNAIADYSASIPSTVTGGVTLANCVTPDGLRTGIVFYTGAYQCWFVTYDNRPYCDVYSYDNGKWTAYPRQHLSLLEMRNSDTATNTAASVSGVTDKTVRNMLHLGYYDTYTIDTNGNYVVTRQTGYLNVKVGMFVYADKNAGGIGYAYYSSLSDIKDYTNKDNIPDYINNYLPEKSANFGWLSETSCLSMSTSSEPKELRMYLSNVASQSDLDAYIASHNIFIQYELDTSYTETYEPNHFARIEPYALEHAKSEADRSSNLCNTFDRSNIPSTSSLYSATLNPDGSYTSTATDDSRSWNYSNSDFKFILEPGTYKLSAIITNGNINIFDSNNNGLPPVFTLTSRTGIGIMVKVFDGSAYIMLNHGSVALPYQPYEGKTVHETGLPLLFIGEATASTAVSTLTSAGNDYFLVPFGSALASGLDASSVSHSFGATNGHVTTAGTMSVNINGIAVDLVSLANFRIYSYAD